MTKSTGTRGKKKPDEPNFEQDLDRLEEIVGALEEGGLSLDDSLKKFEEGIRLAKRCEKTLSAAEKKIELLMKNADGDLVTESFGEDEEEEDGDADEEPDEKSESGGLLF